VWSASGGISVLDFDASSGFLVWFPLDFATTCVGIGGVIYSNFRESRVNVTGPSLVKLTFIMAPNFPSLIFPGEYCVPMDCRKEAYIARDWSADIARWKSGLLPLEVFAMRVNWDTQRTSPCISLTFAFHMSPEGLENTFRDNTFSL